MIIGHIGAGRTDSTGRLPDEETNRQACDNTYLMAWPRYESVKVNTSKQVIVSK